MSKINNLDIDIAVQAEQWTNTVKNIESLIEASVHETLSHIKFKTEQAELSVVLADNDFVQELNKVYRSKDKPTNVLSFPQDEDVLLGDVILAYETVSSEAGEQKKPFEDHFVHLVIHGVLHLLGYDHETDEGAKIMERAEIETLKKLGIKNPYEIQDFVA